jgi:hypothetical protein
VPERIIIHCRRRSSRDCYNGIPASEIYEDGDPAEDGTYDPDTDTVVCDACYI